MKKNIAIVGFGGQGGWHGDHALKSDVVSLAGIYDIKETRCEYARSKGIDVYESFDAVLADENVDDMKALMRQSTEHRTYFDR